MIDTVIKIGSMALIDKTRSDIDYNIFANLSKKLKPGMILVSSGAVEIGRLDYLKRNGVELDGENQDNKTDYAAQGQSVLMQNYRNFVLSKYSIRQILVEHSHFNNSEKRLHIKALMERAANQNAIPIVNYNDAVSYEENRKLEIQKLRDKTGFAYELVDNDETASQIACLVNAKTLLLLTTLDGIYKDVNDKNSLIKEISGKTLEEVIKKLDDLKPSCVGASRAGANGAISKVEYIKPCVAQGAKVIIASSNYDIDDILNDKVPCTKIFVNSH